MECPFELPVKAIGPHFAEGYYFKAECKNNVVLFLCPTEADVDYIVQVINGHEKLAGALKRYSDHEPGCVKGDACICGLRQALKEAEKP